MRTDTSKLFFITAMLCVVYYTADKLFVQESEHILKPILVHSQPLQVKSIEPISFLDRNEVECLAQNIYHEARGESETGMIAVAHVTINRKESRRFPDTICEVVKQARYSKWWKEEKGKLVPLRNKCQFSWYCDGKSDKIDDDNAWRISMLVAVKTLSGNTDDPTKGATHYYNPSLAQPYWRDHYQRVAVVDNHAFYKGY